MQKLLLPSLAVAALATLGALASRNARAAGFRPDPARAAAMNSAAAAVEFEFQGDVNPFAADPKFPREAFPQLAGGAGNPCQVRNVMFCRFTYGDCWILDLGYGVPGATPGHERVETLTVIRFSDQLRIPAFHLAPKGDASPWRHATPRLHAVDALVNGDLAGRYTLAGLDAEAMRAVFDAEGCRKLAATELLGRWRLDGAANWMVVGRTDGLADARDMKAYYEASEQVAGIAGVRVTRYLWPPTSK